MKQASVSLKTVIRKALSVARRPNWLMVTLLISLSGCAELKTLNELLSPPGSPNTQLTIPVIVTATPGPPPTAIRCTENPPGLSIQTLVGVKREERGYASQPVQILGQGFAAGERLYMVIEGGGTSHNIKYEGYMAAADANGRFVSTHTLQLDEPNMRWQVYIVHQRGVACTRFTTS